MDDAASAGHEGPLPLTDWLQQETEGWVADGLITAPQAAAICTRYGVPASIPQGPPAPTTRLPLRAIVLSAALGILAIGLALIVASNWRLLSYGWKLAIVVAPGVAAALAAPWVDRPSWRRIASQFLDAIVVASLLGVAAIISQHAQQSVHDWLGFFLIALAPTILYLELRTSTFLATAAWVAAAGIGVRWLGAELAFREWLGDEEALTNWFIYAMGLVLAIRTRGYWTPLFALVAGVLLGNGLIFGTTEFPGTVLEGTTIGAAAAIVAIGVCALRVRSAPYRVWPLSLTAVVAVSVALLWVNFWDRIIGIPDTVARPLLFEGTWWFAATVTAVVLVGWLRIIQRQRGVRLLAWHTLRWLLLLYAIAGAFAGVGHWLVHLRRMDTLAEGAHPAIEVGVLGLGVVTLGLGWLVLNRTRLLPPLDRPMGESRWLVLLSTGAPLAAGTLLWSLWMPAARLVAYVEPGATAGIVAALAQWGLTVLGAVWVVTLVAQQAREERGQTARITWALVAVLSLALLVEAYMRQDSLLQRGLTFAGVGGALLVGVIATIWRSSRRRPRVRDRGPTQRAQARSQ